MSETGPLSKQQLAQLNQFTSSVWGNPQTVLKRGSGNIEFIDLAKHFDVFESTFAGSLKHDKILVRDEYRTALRELQTDTYYRGAYVTGQPGIGKTVFLIYVLVARLGEKRAVALQFLDGRPFYLLFNNSVTVHSFNDTELLDECGSVWALSDSNDLVQTPSGIFRGGPKRIRIIQTTSPKVSRWKEWSKQTGAQRYVMDIWSEKEVAGLGTLLEREAGVLSKSDVERMVVLAKTWGGVPRTLLEFITRPDRSIEDTYREAAPRAVEKCKFMLAAAGQLNIPDDAPSAFYFLRPLMTSDTIARQHPRVHVPTPTLRDLLGEALRVQNDTIKLEFFFSLSQPAETRQAAGFIYESWFHSFFSSARSIECHWIQGLHGVTTLQGTNNLIASTPKFEKPPYYWIAPWGFPGIDSALVLKGGIFAFQVTIRSKLKYPKEGLRILRNNLPGNLKDVAWRVVFVGPEESAIKAVAEERVGRVSAIGTYVSVGWSAVDPAQCDVTYKVFRDESDTASEEGMQVDIEAEE